MDPGSQASDIQVREDRLEEQVDRVDFSWEASMDKATWLVKPVPVVDMVVYN